MRRRVAVLLTLAACFTSPAVAQVSFNKRFQGGPYQSDVYVNNDSCPGAHTVQVTVQGAAWYRITGQNPVRVAAGQTEYVQAFLDLTNTPVGKHTGTLTFSCLDCPPSCKQSTYSEPLEVEVVPRTATIPRELIVGPTGTFGGVVDNTVPNICLVIQQILKDLEMTKWGQSSRGQKIIERLRLRYTGSDCAGFTFVAHDEVANGKGEPQARVDEAEEQPRIDEGVYVHDPTIFRNHTIFVGLDQRVTSVLRALNDPTSYFAFTHKGKIGVAKKSELVHLLIHEGLHATQAGQYNVAKPQGGANGASLQEEQDGAKAGNEACVALGLPPTDDAPGLGYNAGQNPNYKPLQ